MLRWIAYAGLGIGAYLLWKASVASASTAAASAAATIKSIENAAWNRLTLSAVGISVATSGRTVVTDQSSGKIVMVGTSPDKVLKAISSQDLSAQASDGTQWGPYINSDYKITI